MRGGYLRDAIEVEPLTSIPAAFPEQRARVLRILVKWQQSLLPAGVTPAYPGIRVLMTGPGDAGAPRA